MTNPTPRRVMLAEDTIDQDDLTDLAEWLKTGPWLTQGPLVREFEQRWAALLGTSHAVFVNSGSSANLLMIAALQASGRLRNDSVVVPAVAWSTTVAPIIQLGLRPCLCDAEPRTFGLDPQRLEDLVRQHRPSAVVLVHVLGVPCDMEAIEFLRNKYEFELLEDACAATGSRYDDRPVGSFGTMSSFSFFFGHHLSTIEGGMVATSDPQLLETMLMLRSHGWAKDLSAASEDALFRAHDVVPFNRRFTFYEAGFNLRSSDLNAKIGLRQLDKAPRVFRRRVRNHRRYQQSFKDSPIAVQHNERAEICSISFAGLAPNAAVRERIGAALTQHGIETRPVGGGNMSRQPFWTRRFETTPMEVADRVHHCAFQLPNHPGLTDDDIDFVTEVVRGAATEGQ